MSTTDEQRLREALIQQIERFAAQYPAESGIRYALERCCNYLRAEAAQQAPAPACQDCGEPQSRNPHPKAGDPTLEFGYEWHCIPCLARSRTDWAIRAYAAERELSALSAVPAAQDEWQRFELHFCQGLNGIKNAVRLPNGVYMNAGLRVLWEGWSAALATRTNEGTR